MGSVYTTYSFFPEHIAGLAEFDWNRLARRVFIDPVSGVIALMTPSPAHERQARGLDWAMAAVAGRGYPVAPLGSTRWRLPEDPRNTGAEADACYYLAEKAMSWRAIDPMDDSALEAFVLKTPPDLVIEVERSQGDETKPLAYRRLGVPEMWRIDIAGNTREAVMLDLLAPDGPSIIACSAVLPGATPAFVLDAMELATQGRFAELEALISTELSDEVRG